MMYSNWLTRRIPVLLVGLFCITANISAQSDAGCVAADCHSELTKGEYVHGPVGAGICTVCHTPIKGKDHRFSLSNDEGELCLGCHEEKRDMMLEHSVHTPVADGKCTGCHDPHRARFRFNLKKEGAALCFGCHDKAEFSKEYVHGPVAVGDCVICHSPHASSHEKQLLAPPQQICFTCHPEQEEIMTKAHIHKPVGEKCTNCHSPHSNHARYQLDSDVPMLCFGCHAEIADAIQASHKHPPAAEGQCLKCHNAHASDNPRMFQLPQSGLCFSCHKQMEAFVNANEFRHGPLKEGDCNACHNPHGSSNWRILRKFFPQEFYSSYATENYAICFQCHNQAIALDEYTTTLTDFREKDFNLHYRHVNMEKKGRSCRACHQVHASSQERHIRESVPFGTSDWELPIKYTKFSDGGKCVVGCHVPREYHR